MLPTALVPTTPVPAKKRLATKDYINQLVQEEIAQNAQAQNSPAGQIHALATGGIAGRADVPPVGPLMNQALQPTPRSMATNDLIASGQPVPQYGPQVIQSAQDLRKKAGLVALMQRLKQAQTTP